MTTEQLIALLFGAIAALLGIIWASLVYEIRKLRKKGHKHSSSITALNIIVSLVCKRLGIQWRPEEHEDE